MLFNSKHVIRVFFIVFTFFKRSVLGTGSTSVMKRNGRKILPGVGNFPPLHGMTETDSTSEASCVKKLEWTMSGTIIVFTRTSCEKCVNVKLFCPCADAPCH
jgi:hypothetical protein